MAAHMCAACGRFSDPGQGQWSVIHTSPDRTQCFCIDPDLARTRNLPFLFTTFPFFLTLFGPFFTISWIKTLNKIGGPGPDTTIIFFGWITGPWPRGQVDQGPGGTGGQVGQGVRWARGQGVRWSRGQGTRLLTLTRVQVGQGARWASGFGTRWARDTGGPGGQGPGGPGG